MQQQALQMRATWTRRKPRRQRACRETGKAHTTPGSGRKCSLASLRSAVRTCKRTTPTSQVSASQLYLCLHAHAQMLRSL